MNKFVENLFTIVKTEKIKNQCNKKDETKTEEKSTNINEHGEGPTLLSIDEIFKTRYIEAVQFLEKNKYSEKLIDYVEKTYKGVEIL